MPSWLLELLALLAPVLVGVLSGLLMQGLKRLSTWLDTQGDWTKRSVLLVLNFALTKFAVWTGAQVGTDILLLTPEGADVLISTTIAMVLHNAKKVKAATPPPPAAEE